MRNALRAPAERVASSTARFSTPVTPEGTHTTTRGCAHRFWCTFWMKWRSICSVTSKSAMTPSFSGRMALMLPGVRPSIRLASMPDGVDLARALVDGDHRRLGQHDAAPAHVDERVGGAEVDGHVTAAEPGQVAPEADWSPPLMWRSRPDGPAKRGILPDRRHGRRTPGGPPPGSRQRVPPRRGSPPPGGTRRPGRRPRPLPFVGWPRRPSSPTTTARTGGRCAGSSRRSGCARSVAARSSRRSAGSRRRPATTPSLAERERARRHADLLERYPPLF